MWQAVASGSGWMILETYWYWPLILRNIEKLLDLWQIAIDQWDTQIRTQGNHYSIWDDRFHSCTSITENRREKSCAFREWDSIINMRKHTTKLENYANLRGFVHVESVIVVSQWIFGWVLSPIFRQTQLLCPTISSIPSTSIRPLPFQKICGSVLHLSFLYIQFLCRCLDM